MFKSLLLKNLRFHGQAYLLFTHVNAFFEFDSTIFFPTNQFCSRDISNANTIAHEFSFIGIPYPTEAVNLALILLKSSLRTPTIPASPGLPPEEPSTFHFSLFEGGEHHLIKGLCILDCFQSLTQSSFETTHLLG